MPENLAEQYKEQMAKPDLVFLTKDNEDKVNKLAGKAVSEEELEKARCKSCAALVTGPHDCPGPFADADSDG